MSAIIAIIGWNIWDIARMELAVSKYNREPEASKIFTDIDYVQEHFELFQKYNHRCKFCNGKMQIIKEPQFLQEEIICPECGSKLEKVSSMDWD